MNDRCCVRARARARDLQGGRGCSTLPTGYSEGPGGGGKRGERKKRKKKSAILIWEERSATPVLVNRIHPSRRAVRPQRVAITAAESRMSWGSFFVRRRRRRRRRSCPILA